MSDDSPEFLILSNLALKENYS